MAIVCWIERPRVQTLLMSQVGEAMPDEEAFSAAAEHATRLSGLAVTSDEQALCNWLFEQCQLAQEWTAVAPDQMEYDNGVRIAMAALIRAKYIDVAKMDNRTFIYFSARARRRLCGLPP